MCLMCLRCLMCLMTVIVVFDETVFGEIDVFDDRV